MNHTFLFLIELLGQQGKQTHTQARHRKECSQQDESQTRAHTHGMFGGMYRTQGRKIPRRSGA